MLQRVFPKSVEELISYFEKFPGVGPKSAARMAFHLLNVPENQAMRFAELIMQVKTKIKRCTNCFNLSEESLCPICSNSEREQDKILVVEDVLDLIAFEKSAAYKGIYHVLGGAISPMNGIGPEELTIGELLKRVKTYADSKPIEIIIATNPNLEGEATAMYLKQELHNIKNVTITRLARGLPSGADLDYLDTLTLTKAFSGRTDF